MIPEGTIAAARPDVNWPPMPIIPDKAASEGGKVGNYLVIVLNKRQSAQLYHCSLAVAQPALHQLRRQNAAK